MGRGSKVDLIVQRDSRGFPVIYKTSIKGAIKSHCSIAEELAKVSEDIFGEDVEPGSVKVDYGLSKVVFSDAYLLAFPVAIEENLFVYVSSPYMLKRIRLIAPTESKLALFINSLLNKCRSLKGNSAIVSESIRDIFESNLMFERKIDVIGTFSETINLPEAEYPFSEFSKRLAILSDEVLEEAMGELPHAYRISTDYQLKKVKYGGLWSEEYVPSGSIFLGLMLVSRYEFSEKEEKPVKIDLSYFLNELFKNNVLYLFLGRKETVGKGLVKIVRY